MLPNQLSIKTNAVRRLINEYKIYTKEVSDQESYVEQLKSANTDEYEVKKQIEILEESKRMVVQLKTKVAQSKEGLAKYLETYNGDEDVTEAKLLVA